MRLHPRTIKVQAARARLFALTLDFQDEHELTDTEMLALIIYLAERAQVRLLRAERHPDDPSKKADEA